MKPKPAHLGPQYGAQFGDEALVAAYARRPAYADEAVDLVLGLTDAETPRVLDIGCGRGELAIPLAARGAHVDGVDPSAAMLAAARTSEGGDAPGLRWMHGGIEDAPLAPPYDLATAAQSLHWTEWSISLPRIASVLRGGAMLVLLERKFAPTPWDDELVSLIERHSTNQEYEPYVLIDELTSRGLFVERGRRETAWRANSQSIADFVESCHSRNGFSRDRMTAESARQFDDAVTALVRKHVGDGPVVIDVATQVVWGRPQAPPSVDGLTGRALSSF